MDKRCDIIIPVWNQLDATKKCISSINEATEYPFRLILVDNDSETDTASYLDGLKEDRRTEVVLIRNSENVGFVKAVNQALKIADSAYICIMNNDTIATPGWLEEMVDIMERNAHFGILNPSSNTSGQSPAEGQSIEDYASQLVEYRGQIQELNICRGFCMLMRKSVKETVGLLDEGYSVGYFEESDYCKRAAGLGYLMGRAKASYVYHCEGLSFQNVPARNDIFKQNEKLYYNRWGRRVRAAYLIEGDGRHNQINDIVSTAARRGHQFVVFLKRGIDYPVRVDHFDIRRMSVGSISWPFRVVYEIVKRRAKKPIEIIATDNMFFGKLLNATKSIHGAIVCVCPEKDSMMKLLDEKSRQY